MLWYILQMLIYSLFSWVYHITINMEEMAVTHAVLNVWFAGAAGKLQTMFKLSSPKLSWNASHYDQLFVPFKAERWLH